MFKSPGRNFDISLNYLVLEAWCGDSRLLRSEVSSSDFLLRQLADRRHFVHVFKRFDVFLISQDFCSTLQYDPSDTREDGIFVRIPIASRPKT